MKPWMLLAGLLATGCTNESATRRTLTKAGFTEVRITGWSWLSCGRDDFTCTEFSAKNASGMAVTGAVGCGMIFKNCTIRF